MKYNHSILLHTFIAALLVISGVVIKNSYEQMGMPDHPIGKPLGMMLFTIGWIYVAYILSHHKKNKLLFIVPSLAILSSVITMKNYMAEKIDVPMILPIIFALSWILLGFGVGNHLKGNLKFTGLIASACVLASMLYSLPQQRKMCIVDGPGMPLFVIGWFIIALLNSLQN